MGKGFEASVCVIPANIPLAKASHVAKAFAPYQLHLSQIRNGFPGRRNRKKKVLGKIKCSERSERRC